VTWVMWSLISVCLETVLVSVQDKCRCKIGTRFAPNVQKVQKSFWTRAMVLLGDEAQVKACFGSVGDSANLDTR
jgi:hypothetical protein